MTEKFLFVVIRPSAIGRNSCITFITCIEDERERERCHRAFQGLRILMGFLTPLLLLFCRPTAAFIEIPTTIRALRREGRLCRRVNFTRHYPDVDFFVLSGRGATWKPLEDLFSMDDGPPGSTAGNLPWNVCKDGRCNAMYREASDWWGPRTFLVLYANYRLTEAIKWQPWNINLLAGNNFSKIY